MHMFAVGVGAYAVAFGILFATRQARGAALITAVLVAVCTFTLGEMIVAVSGMVVVNQLAPDRTAWRLRRRQPDVRRPR